MSSQAVSAGAAGRDSYLTLHDTCSYELRISRSVFIAHAFPVSGTEAAVTQLSQLRKRHHDAAHFPYAYVTGINSENYRYSDDGEPSGTGGKPIYDCILKHSLSDVLVAVVRYFGGIKLGTGGLKRAFFESADMCLQSAEKKEVIIKEEFELETGYEYISGVMRLIETEGATIAENRSAEKVRLLVSIRKSGSADLRSKFISATNGSAIFKG